MKQEYYDKRKILLINPSFQLSIIKKFFALQALLSIVIISIFLWQFLPVAEQASNLTLSESHPFVVAFEKFQFMLITITICLSIFLACAFYLAALTISNRIAGPLYNLQKHLKDIRTDDKKVDSFPHLKFRKKDYFHGLAEEVNLFLDSVKKRD